MSNLIAIEVEGEFIDLNESSIRIEKTNPFFSPNVYQGDYSFPFTLPLTEKNLKKFGFINSLSVSNKRFEYTAYLHLFGVPQQKSKLTVTRTTSRAISVVLSSGIKALSNADNTLKQILSGGYYLGGDREEIAAKATEISKEGDWSVYGFTFVPFYAPNFYNGLNADFCGIVNRMDPTTGDIHANDNSDPRKYVLVPFLFLHFVLNECFKKAGFTPSGSFWTNSETNKLLLSNNFAIELKSADDNSKLLSYQAQVINTTTQRPQFYPSVPGAYDNLNAYDYANKEYVIQKAGTFKFNIYINGRVLSTSVIKPILPDAGHMRLYYDGTLITSVFLQADYGTNTTFIITHTIVASAGDIGKVVYVDYLHSSGTFQANSYFELSGESVFDVVVESTKAATSNTMLFKNHVQENTTFSELLAEVKKLGVNIDFDFNTATVVLDLVDEKLKAVDSPDMTSKSEPGFENVMEESGNGISINYQFDDDEKAEVVIDENKYKGEFFDDGAIPLPLLEGETIIITNTNEVLKVTKPVSGSLAWEKAGHNYSAYKFGAGKQSLNCKLAPMLMCKQTNEGGTADENTAIMPYYVGIGSSDLHGLGINSFKHRLVFYRGVNNEGTVATPKGGVYVLATTTRYGINGNVVGNYSFRVDQTTGLIRSTSDRLYTAITNSEVVEKNMYFDAMDLISIKAFSKMVIENDLFLVKSLSIYITKKVAKVKAYLLKI